VRPVLGSAFATHCMVVDPVSPCLIAMFLSGFKLAAFCMAELQGFYALCIYLNEETAAAVTILPNVADLVSELWARTRQQQLFLTSNCANYCEMIDATDDATIADFMKAQKRLCRARFHDDFVRYPFGSAAENWLGRPIVSLQEVASVPAFETVNAAGCFVHCITRKRRLTLSIPCLVLFVSAWQTCQPVSVLAKVRHGA